MNQELIKALLVIFDFCNHQDKCKKCPMRDFCGRPVSSWNDPEC